MPVLTWQFVKLTEKGGKPIVPFNPLIILVIVLAVIVIIAWRFRTRKNVAKDRQLKSSASTKCQICGQDNPLEAGFCGNCGATLLAAVEAPRPAVAPVVTVEYVGGMTRLGAAIIDGVIVLIILVGLTGFRYWFGFIGLLWLFSSCASCTIGSSSDSGVRLPVRWRSALKWWMPRAIDQR